MEAVDIHQAKRYKVVFDYIRRYGPNKILEIWCGSQWIWKCYNIQFDWLDLTTSDYSWKEKYYNKKNMNFIKGSALDIPIKDETYDFVFSTDMIEHIKRNNREKAFKEAFRVCKKGWYVLFLFPCWIWWKTSDYFIYIVYKFLKLKIPWRLKEHLELDFPYWKEINKYLYNLGINKHIIKNCKVHNIFIWNYYKLLTLGSKKEKIIDNILNKSTPEKSSLFWIRKLILIKK